MKKKAARKSTRSTSTRATEEPSSRKTTTANAAATHHWTFLTNHAHVLILLQQQPDLVLREVAHQVGITERAVQRIVHDLEAAGYLTITRVGRKNHYQIHQDLHLRHPIESHRTIGELIQMVAE